MKTLHKLIIVIIISIHQFEQISHQSFYTNHGTHFLSASAERCGAAYGKSREEFLANVCDGNIEWQMPSQPASQPVNE